jgi:hypothetical protein
MRRQVAALIWAASEAISPSSSAARAWRAKPSAFSSRYSWWGISGAPEAVERYSIIARKPLNCNRFFLSIHWQKPRFSNEIYAAVVTSPEYETAGSFPAPNSV